MKRALFIILGLLCVGLGILGMVLPILPTTPFLLLALWLFTRSSERLREWLLTNRLCGKYLSNYQNGYGIPLKVKIIILVMLWLTIGYAALFVVKVVWIQALLLIIALCVSAHVVRVKTYRRLNSRVVILFPTHKESSSIDKTKVDADIVICGIGAANTSYHTLRAIEEFNPSLIILAGIAGAYSHTDLMMGEVVVVKQEYDADLGTLSSGEFEPRFATRLTNNSLAIDSIAPNLRRINSNTVNSAGTPFADPSQADIENMEGWGFFRAAIDKKVPFIEIRAISNVVKEGPEKWDVPLALEHLSKELNKIVK